MSDDRSKASLPSSPGGQTPSVSSTQLITEKQFIKAEANLMRLPLFALSTKSLRTLDGIECRGVITREGNTQDYRFRATRNAATLYPGPLARSVHLALLSIATEHGVPVMNPVEWSWRDLCRRMGIVYGGKITRQLEQAITSTAGLLLWSEFALYSKEEKSPIQTRKNALHLYDQVAFRGQVKHDGSIADTNYVWFADWYVRNLNSLFTAPLNYALWRQLDEKSTIASRLYEFLLLNFHRRIPALRINYPTLAQMLPIRPERYFSSAQHQLAAPLRLLVEHRIIGEVSWARTREGVPQLQFKRGDHLRLHGTEQTTAFAEAEAEFAAPVQVKELHNLRSAENSLVADFYRLWSGEENHRATGKELDQARHLVLEYGTTDAKKLLPLVVNRLHSRWPSAKTLTAAVWYFPEIAKEYGQEKRQIEERDQARQRRVAEQQKLDEQQLETRRFRSIWKPRWDALSEADREAIRRTVETSSFLKQLAVKKPAALEFHYLRELARRSDSAK